jgi:uncharacterized damage-inducible protein DinB
MSPAIREALPDPPVDADEKTMLSAYLDWYRDAVLRKLEGLDTQAATRRLVPSSTTILGIVKHLAYVERGWFQGSFLGEPVQRLRTSDDPDAEFRVESGDTVQDVADLYRREIERNREILAEAQLDDHARRPDRRDFSLRWIVVHMIEETARHAGHLDILREQTDGATGK